MRKAGLREKKGETLSFEKIFWTENMCAILVSLTEKQLPFFPNARGSGSLITFQGHWPEGEGFLNKCVQTRD